MIFKWLFWIQNQLVSTCSACSEAVIEVNDEEQPILAH